MKLRRYRLKRFRVRLQPGRILHLKPHVLHAMGWSVDDVLILSFKGTGPVTVFKKPTETEWRIDRLARRINGISFDKFDRCPPTLAGFRAMGRKKK